MAALINIVIFNLATFVSSIILLGKYSDGEAVNSEIAILMVAMFILQVLFMVIGSATAAVKKKPKTAASVATGILLLMYMLSMIIDLNESIKGIRYFTPFKYFEAKNVMYGGGLDVSFVVISLILILYLRRLHQLQIQRGVGLFDEEGKQIRCPVSFKRFQD
ncbi:hypothetical protein LSPH24S_02026 [Lysinibacillus sphaericus]